MRRRFSWFAASDYDYYDADREASGPDYSRPSERPPEHQSRVRRVTRPCVPGPVSTWHEDAEPCIASVLNDYITDLEDL